MNSAHVARNVAMLVLAAIGTSTASAQNAPWYAGVMGGESRAKIDDARIAASLLASGFTTQSIADDDRDTGFKVFGGYQFNRYFSIEGGYFNLGKFGFTATTIPTGTLNGRIKLKGASLDLVATIPITERFSAFAMAGVARAEARDQFTGTGSVNVRNPNPYKRANNGRGALGLQFAMTDSLALRTQVERYRIDDAVGNKGDVDMVSVGLVYRFGGRADRYVARNEVSSPEPVRAVVVSPPPASVPVTAPAVASTPPPPPAPPRIEKYTLSATEMFAFNSAALTLPQLKLDEIANALNAHAEVRNVVVTGYADRIGSMQYNQALSERRAGSVKDYLISKGVTANRLQAQGRGEANPVVVCTNKNRPALIKCLEPNRRVEIEQITITRRIQ